jgi:hypothetical protein
LGKRLLEEYQRLTAEDQRTFNKWLKANATFGAILFIGMMAMAWLGANSVGRNDAAIAIGSKYSDIVRSK